MKKIQYRFSPELRKDMEIIKKLEEIERHHNIKILFAVESGSRAWNMESEDSDYDIRFVYMRNPKDYFRLNPPKNSIEIAFDKDWNQTKENRQYDILGFDILKFTGLLQSSNPTTIEWLNSGIVYIDEGTVKEQLKLYSDKYFKPRSLWHHYRSMCKQNYLKYLQAGNLVTYKKYLYAYRGLVNAKYVAKFRDIPSMDFPKTIEYIKGHLEPHIVERLLDIIKLKKTGEENDAVKNYRDLDEYIINFLEENDAPRDNGVAPTCDKLNEILRSAAEIWK